MALKTNTIVHVTAIDDLDGSAGPDVATRTLSIDGVSLEIELSKANWDDVLEALAPVREKARVVKPGRKPKGTAKRVVKPDAAATREENKRIKEWGRSPEGQAVGAFVVTDRGQPSKELRRAYLAAQMDLPSAGVGVPEFVSAPDTHI